MELFKVSTSEGRYPLVAVRDGIIFPYTEGVLIFGRKRSLEAIKKAFAGDKKIVLVMQKNPRKELPPKEDLYQVGVLATIKKIVSGERGELNVLLKGEKKIKTLIIESESPFFMAKIAYLEDETKIGKEVIAYVKHISNVMKEAISYGKTIDFTFLMNILNITDPESFSYQVAVVLDIRPFEKQKLLEEVNLEKRLRMEVEMIDKELNILKIEKNISRKTQEKFEKGMKQTFLREKMRTIEQELGKDKNGKEVGEYRERIKKAMMPKMVEKKALKELKRLSQMSQYNPEASYIRTYIDWLIELPWRKPPAKKIDINNSKAILNRDHYGLKKVKERILEFLAVIKLLETKKTKEGDKKGLVKLGKQPTILCFVGPPGVGKTSLGKSIARALGRKFVKISLGGIRDEAEIRGHRRTYVGALPGRIIQGIKEAGTNNPVFMLDEIDKVGRDYRGDPSAALLDALDPEQNATFSDHYLEVPFDLSQVFFITTANILDTIPAALLDRLEIIHFPGYTSEEKFNIAKKYLLKKQLLVHGLEGEGVKISDSALKMIIGRYTYEAGVRELERQIAAIFRKVARKLVEKKLEKKTIKLADLQPMLGPYKYSLPVIEEKDAIGIATGLAWTMAGGQILFIEVALMPGKGSLTLTGHLGEVMKESCQAALSYVRSRWKKFGLKEKFFEKINIHVHVPEGAVSKDGPSAGVSITTAMVSALTKRPVKREVAMTGEITLRGRVLPIGGVREKVIAAHRAKIKTVILPKENKKDLVEIPEKVKKDLHFIFVSHMDEVLSHALNH